MTTTLCNNVDEQLHIYNRIIQAVMSQTAGMFFLYGYGGTGKTYMWKTLASALRAKKKIVLTVASSGLASLLLPGGQTAHSKFRIPVPTLDNSVCNIHQGSELAKLLKQTSLIIWDEAPMAHRYCFEALDKTLRDIMRITDEVDIIFGGKVIVFGGDFRQILPVIPRGTRSYIVHATINASYLWDHCTVLTLTKNMRLQAPTESEYALEVADFAKWILQIGDGNLGHPNDGYATIEIPPDLLISDYINPIDAIVQSTYPNLTNHFMDPQFLQSRAILASTNELVEQLNDYVLSIIPDLHQLSFISTFPTTPL